MRCKQSGSADKVLLLGFRNPALKPLTGKTLGEVARARGKTPEDTAIDLVIEDGSRVQVAYFQMNEANVRDFLKLPWVSFGSDAEAQAPEGPFLLSSTHPRAYGNFARVLGKYARDETGDHAGRGGAASCRRCRRRTWASRTAAR